MSEGVTAGSAGDETRVYPTDPQAQKQWVEDSIACRLADLKARVERRKPEQENTNA